MRHIISTTTIAAAFLAATLFFLPSAQAGAHETGMIVKQSANSVGETLDKLQAILKKKGITVFARVDHTAGAEKVGLKLPPTQLLVFGAPAIGTPLMQSRRSIAIDLPMKALAWKDKAGVWLAYNDPAYLAKRHNITDRKKVFAKMGKALDKMTTAATK